MKNTGIVRRIDELGRIVIPKEIRKIFKIDKNEAVEMFVDDDSIILKKFSAFIDETKLKTICESLAAVAGCPVVIASKKCICARERISENSITENFISKNSENFNLTKTEVQTAPKFLELFKNNFSQIIISPVIIDLNCEFLIFALFKTNKQLQAETMLAALAATTASKL